MLSKSQVKEAAQGGGSCPGGGGVLHTNLPRVCRLKGEGNGNSTVLFMNKVLINMTHGGFEPTIPISSV